MKKILSLSLNLIAFLAILLPVVKVYADEINPYEVNLPFDEEHIWADEFFEELAINLGLPFYNREDYILSQEQISSLLKITLNKETILPNASKDSIIQSFAESFNLTESQIKYIIPHGIQDPITVKDLDYIIIALASHPLTKDFVRINSTNTIIDTHKVFCIKIKDCAEALLDYEMALYFVPRYIYFYSEDSNLIDMTYLYLTARHTYNNWYLFRNASIFCDLDLYEHKWLEADVLYKSSWLHVVSMRGDTNIFDDKYSSDVAKWYQEFESEYLSTDFQSTCRNISSFLASKLHKSNSITLVDAIETGGVSSSGYADAFKFLANMHGIDCILVGNSKLPHAWVKIYNDDIWLNSDPMLDDVGDYSLPLYQLKTDEGYEECGHPTIDWIY